MHPDRHAYFRYQGLQRLGNLTTTRSNVYAVWITVGYFEVLPWTSDGSGNYEATSAGGKPTVDPAHPDGYMLGQELVDDARGLVRHRAFYIVDRSIPTGFVRGLDVNHEKACW